MNESFCNSIYGVILWNKVRVEVQKSLNIKQLKNNAGVGFLILFFCLIDIILSAIFIDIEHVSIISIDIAQSLMRKRITIKVMKRVRFGVLLQILLCISDPCGDES